MCYNLIFLCSGLYSTDGSLETSLDKYSALFKEELHGMGLTKGVNVKIHEDTHARPLFLKPSIRLAIGGSRHIRASPVTWFPYSQRRCIWQYSAVLRVANLEKYPLPRMEDMIYIILIAKGKVFTKLDLTNENMHACS